MPAKSEAQQHMMGMALAHKRGEAKGKPSKGVMKLMRSMSLEQLEEYAKKPKKGYRK